HAPARRLRAGGWQIDAEPAGTEPRRTFALSQDRVRRGGDRGVAGDAVPGGARAAAGADHPRSGRHRRPAARASGEPLLPRLLRLLLLSAAVRVLRPAPVGGQAAPLRHRRQCGQRRGGCADRPANPHPLAVCAHPAASRQWLCARGDMENRIKECQLDLYADRASAQTMRANQLRLWFAAMAYVLICAMRRIALADTAFANATCGTIRLKFLKIGALVRISVRRI